MEFEEIAEGKTKLLVPKESVKQKKGAGAIIEGLFYNPSMRLKRSINVSMSEAFGQKIVYADVLAATGASGIRIAKETRHEVYLNDISKSSCETIKKNAALNRINSKVKIYNKEANQFLLENKNRFDFIDIDPFGSPSRFCEAAVISLKNSGVLGVTATDKAALYGNHPLRCFQRYNALPIKFPASNELGLRILLGYIARIAAKHERGIECLLSFSTMHYYRAYIKVEKKDKKVKETLANLGYLYHCPECLNFFTASSFLPLQKKCECRSELRTAGILWTGKIKNNAFCKAAIKKSKDEETKEFIKSTASEGDAPFYHDLHALASSLKKNPPDFEDAISELRKLGFETSRTHFSQYGIKTGASLKEITALF